MTLSQHSVELVELKHSTDFEANRNYCIAVLENLDAKEYREAISYLKKPNLSDEDNNNNIRFLSRILKFMKNYNDNILMTEVLSINLSALQNANWPSSSETKQTQEPKTSTL